jgi:hypothetical protein
VVSGQSLVVHHRISLRAGVLHLPPNVARIYIVGLDDTMGGARGITEVVKIVQDISTYKLLTQPLPLLGTIIAQQRVRTYDKASKLCSSALSMGSLAGDQGYGCNTNSDPLCTNYTHDRPSLQGICVCIYKAWDITTEGLDLG